MRNSAFVSFLSVCAVTVSVGLVTVPALRAQEGRRGEAGSFFSFNPILSAVDANKDLQISADELDAAPTALATLDTNGDGTLTPDEVRPNMGREGGFEREDDDDEGPAPAPNASSDLVSTLLAFDNNGDGELSTAEVPERMQGLFSRGDTDHNGVLSKDELSALAAADAPPAAQEGRRGRGGREGADREGGGRAARGGRGRAGFPDPMFTALDANQDGAIGPSEIADSGAALLKLDRNGDGVLTEDDVRPAGRGRGGRGFGRRGEAQPQ